MTMPAATPLVIRNLVEHLIWVPAENRAEISGVVITLEKFTGRHQTNSEGRNKSNSDGRNKSKKNPKSQKSSTKYRSDKKHDDSDSHHSKKR